MKHTIKGRTKGGGGSGGGGGGGGGGDSGGDGDGGGDDECVSSWGGGCFVFLLCGYFGWGPAYVTLTFLC